MMQRILAIAINTFRESARGKIFLSTLFLAFFLVGVAALFGTVTIGDQVKVIKDFGLFSISLFSVAFAVISGGALLDKELSRKTVYTILSKSVRRPEFLLGKYFGMLFTVFSLVGILGVGLICFAWLFEARLDLVLIQGFFFIFFEAIIVCACAIFFSSIVITPLLSGLFTFGVFLAGRSVEYLKYFQAEDTGNAALTHISRILSILLPRFDHLNLSNAIVYGQGASVSTFLWSLAYASSYAAILLLLASAFFSRREFN